MIYKNTIATGPFSALSSTMPKRRWLGLALTWLSAMRTLSDGIFHERIQHDFKLAQRAILQITGQSELLDNNPVIQKSIRLRNPYTDVLNLLQTELLRRWRELPEDNSELRQSMFLAINGIAAAMHSTG